MHSSSALTLFDLIIIIGNTCVYATISYQNGCNEKGLLCFGVDLAVISVIRADAGSMRPMM